MGAIAGGRWMFRSSGCVVGTCMHHMRGRMGSEATCTRKKEQQSGQEESNCLLLSWESGRGRRGRSGAGRGLGCQVSAAQISD